MPSIALLGTLDTKLNEYLKLRELLIVAGASNVILIDAGRKETNNAHITITQPELLQSFAPKDVKRPDIEPSQRGEIVSFMARCASSCVQQLYHDGRIHGIVAAGGSGGTALATLAMRQLPMGFPKLMVSTVASGDTSSFVGETDICMMYSVVDIAGWNEMLQTVFSNAASSIIGMAQAFETRQKESRIASDKRKRRVGITMFGVTTPCVDMIRERLEAENGDEVYVFHATGHGGKAMERLVEAGELDAVVDLTTSEICDHLMGGNMSAGPDRLNAALKAGVPCVISVGACDMVNFGPKETVPERYRNRRLYVHNSAVTLMRTTSEECQRIAEFICEKIRTHVKRRSAVKVILPEGGVSLIATKGQLFEDLEADRTLFSTIKNGLSGSSIECISRSEAINEENFAAAVMDALSSLE